jgi:hypothetical protein
MQSGRIVRARSVEEVLDIYGALVHGRAREAATRWLTFGQTAVLNVLPPQELLLLRLAAPERITHTLFGRWGQSSGINQRPLSQQAGRGEAAAARERDPRPILGLHRGPGVSTASGLKKSEQRRMTAASGNSLHL